MAGTLRGDEDDRAAGPYQLRLIDLFRFMGIGIVVGVAYTDPGNWGTDIAAGSRFGYSLLWVVLMSNLIGMLLQYLSSKLGIVTGQSLADNCRLHLPRWQSLSLWGTAEVAAIATDLAEVIGATIAINLLFGIPLIYGALLTALDTLLILALERKGVKKVEAVIIGMVAIIGLAYILEIYLAKPDWSQIAYHAFIPQLYDPQSLVVAVGILGATVMPHAIFLHSATAKARADLMSYGKPLRNKHPIIRFSLIDTVIALGLAGLVNGAILVVSASVFYSNNIDVESIENAYKSLAPLLGSLSSTAFAIALLASGLASSAVATLAGQVIFEGFTNWKIKLWKRRIITRLITLIPAIIAISLGANALDLLVVSQVVLSLQLPFTVIPLVYFSGKKEIMGANYVNKRITRFAALVCTGIILTMNILLLMYQFVLGA
ncbi:MAG: Nramp family divalent metal transporter [Thermoproteota archaeon]|nr:Nramp family divalent metal transporter [Thermoproteota archaeon]